MVNIWNPYQCMVTFNMSRSARTSRPGSAAAWASATRTRTFWASSTSCPRGRGNASSTSRPPRSRTGAPTTSTSPHEARDNDVGSGFNDDPLWLISGTRHTSRSRETSRSWESCRLRQRPEGRRSALRAPEALVPPRAQELGPHGLPSSAADWNDCLNLTVSRTRRASRSDDRQPHGPDPKSVSSRPLRPRGARLRPPSAEAMGLPRGESGREHAARMEKTVSSRVDGQWFLRAYDFFGKKAGSKECEDGDTSSRRRATA